VSQRAKAVDIVLVEMGPKRTKVLRQFVPPCILVTNRTGDNQIIRLDDLTAPVIVGVVVREAETA
jgi:hypothetical protein